MSTYAAFKSTAKRIIVQRMQRRAPAVFTTSEAEYRAITRRVIVRRMQRRNAWRKAQLHDLNLVTANTMRKRLGKPHLMLCKPLFKGTSR